MSRSAAAIDPGRTNRRFILLAVTLGLIGAVLVYVAFSRESSSGGGAADTPVVVAKQDIPARTRITNDMVEVRYVPQDASSQLSFPEQAGVVGQVTRFPIAANEQVLSSKIVPFTTTSAAASRSLSYVIPPGRRAIAISVSEVQNAGGLVLPGDYVDILVQYDVEFASGTQDAFAVQTLLQNIEVLAVSQTIVDVVPEAAASTNGQRARNTEARPDADAATVTLALTPAQAQRVYLAEGNGQIRISVRPYGDANEEPLDVIYETDLLPRNLPIPVLR